MSFQERVGWKAVAAEGIIRPPARSGHTLVSANDTKCYLFGGFDGTKCFNDTWVLDLSDETKSGTWREISYDHNNSENHRPPAPRASHAACWCEGYGMVVLGGSGERFGFSSYDDVFIFEPNSERWFNITDCGFLEAMGKKVSDVIKRRFKVPYGSHWNFDLDEIPPRGYGRAAVFDPNAGLVWVFGGTDGANYTDHVWCLNLEIGKWARLIKFSGTAPTPRYLSRMVYLDSGSLLLVGGGVPPYCFTASPIDVYHFHLKTLTWSKVKSPSSLAPIETIPRARFAHTVSKLDEDTLFVFGGSARDIDPEFAQMIGPQFGGNIRAYPDAVMYCDAWLYSIKDNIWERIMDYEGSPGCLDFLASASLRGGKDVLVFGGFNKKERSNQALRLRLCHYVPTLENMCLKRIKEQRTVDPDDFPDEDELECFLPEKIVHAIFG